MKALYLCVLIPLVLGGCDQNSNDSTASSQADDNNSSDGASQAMQRYTKDEFAKVVAGKTKPEIRAEFGSPDKVDDSEEGVVKWIYFHLPVYDADAGTEVGTTTISFAPDYVLTLYGAKCADDKAKECVATVSYD